MPINAGAAVSKNLVSSQLQTLHDRTGLVRPDDVENVLTKVDAENRGISGLGCSRHCFLLLPTTALCREETGRTIPLN